MNYSITGFCVLYSDYLPYDLALHTFIWLGMVQFGTSNSNMAMHAFVCLSKIQVGISNTNLAMQALIWFSMVQSVTSNSNFRPLHTLKMPNQKKVPQLAKYGIITNSQCCFYLNNDRQIRNTSQKVGFKGIAECLSVNISFKFLFQASLQTSIHDKSLSIKEHKLLNTVYQPLQSS